MVAVLDVPLHRGASSGKVLVGHAQNGGAVLDGGGLDHRNGVGQHVVTIDALGGHNGGGGHDPLEIVLGGYHQDQVPYPAGFAIGVYGDQGQQVADGVHAQVVHLDLGLLGIHASGHRNIVTHLAVHADGFVVAGAGEDCLLQAVGKGLVHYLADVAVQPLGAQVKHGLAHGQEGRELKQAAVNLFEARGELLHNLVAQLAPGPGLVAVGIHQHLDGRAGVGEGDAGQQRVRGLHLVKHRVQHGGRHYHVQVGQSLAGVFRLDGLAKLLVILFLLGGQLAHAPVGEHLGVNLHFQALHLLLVLLLDFISDGFHHLVESIHKGLLVIVFQRLHHLFPDVGALHNIIVNHGGYSSFLVK